MATRTAQLYGTAFSPPAVSAAPELGEAASAIHALFGARAISLLTAHRQAATVSSSATRLSANDCFVALDTACMKMARVAVRLYTKRGDSTFEASLPTLFPDGAAYLARAVKSVVLDELRKSRREIHTVSLDAPVRSPNSDLGITLGDTVADDDEANQPELAAVRAADQLDLRSALGTALKTMPQNYLHALARDMARSKEREEGAFVTPDSDRERQTLCRARAALATILRRECEADNPFIQLLKQKRSGRVRRHPQPANALSGERQQSLFRRLMGTGWASRAAERADDGADEAIVNDVTAASNAAPPSPELRQTMRVLDLYTVERSSPKTPVARELYERARSARESGRLEEALQLFRSTHEADPSFLEALNEVGVVYSRLGNLRDALRTYLTIIDRDPSGDDRLIAATNAADIYLTWFDAGRNRDRNIAQATLYAKLAMQRPTPMRACNLILAYAKDRYYSEARDVLETVVHTNAPRCTAEKFLQTLFQVRDADLISWWSWLEEELGKEQQTQ